MATNHNYIYLGQERGKRRVYKVGMTQQTCHARCRKADFRIGIAFEISGISADTLKIIENEVLLHFRDEYSIEHGLEYFRMPKHNWEQSSAYFTTVVTEVLTEKNLQYEIKRGWVEPYSY